MSISRYTPFFHDGSIIDIQHLENRIIFSMASAEMDKEDIRGDLTLSNDNSIQGKLHLDEIKEIVINNKPFEGILRMDYDNGKIFELDINRHSFEISIDWVNFRPKPQVNEFSVIRIKAEKIWWENIPDLEVI